jgi:SAM-dependent methyltransferase
MGRITDTVANHYTHGGLGEAILQALAAAGKDPDRLKPKDLAPVDEFHVRGREASLELAALAELGPESRVLDVGCGIGGPSRLLAAEFGCRVTGIDLTEEYCRVAAMLAERTGLAERVDYRQGDALAMPFEDGSFDVVWSQHAAMNIADKAALYAEMRRVSKPGGRLAIYDMLAGTGGEVIFPVPWAREPAYSFLCTPEELRGVLGASGFEELHWRDTTAQGRDAFRARVSAAERDGPPPLGLHLLLGPEFGRMAKNTLRNLEENRIAVIETVWRAV